MGGLADSCHSDGAGRAGSRQSASCRGGCVRAEENRSYEQEDLHAQERTRERTRGIHDEAIRALRVLEQEEEVTLQREQSEQMSALREQQEERMSSLARVQQTMLTTTRILFH